MDAPEQATYLCSDSLVAPPAAVPGPTPTDLLPEACANKRSSSRVLCEVCVDRRACLSAACLAI